MTGIFCKVDEKFVPLYRIVWASALPHFCGATECQREGQYEIRLEHDESVWASREERDAVLDAIQRWQSGTAAPDEESEP
jgi:hypothetical protein